MWREEGSQAVILVACSYNVSFRLEKHELKEGVHCLLKSRFSRPLSGSIGDAFATMRQRTWSRRSTDGILEFNWFVFGFGKCFLG